MSHPTGPTMPTIGRIVHVVHHKHGDVAAIVTKVCDSGIIHATMFMPDGQPPTFVTAEHLEPRPGTKPAPCTWHWPAIR